jgi:hypothetical protein
MSSAAANRAGETGPLATKSKLSSKIIGLVIVSAPFIVSASVILFPSGGRSPRYGGYMPAQRSSSR